MIGEFENEFEEDCEDMFSDTEYDSLVDSIMMVETQEEADYYLKNYKELCNYYQKSLSQFN